MTRWDRFVGSLPASDSWSSHQGCVHCCAGLQPCLYSRTKPTLTFLQVSCPCSCKHQGHKILLITLQLLTKWVWLAKGGHTASALMSRQLITEKPYAVTYSRLPKDGAVYLLPLPYTCPWSIVHRNMASCWHVQAFEFSSTEMPSWHPAACAFWNQNSAAVRFPQRAAASITIP